jgi:hypothetical protein
MKRTSTPCDRGRTSASVDDLVVVDAALDHGVDLDRVEPGLLGRLDAVEHPLEFVAAGHLLELRPVERVEADVDPPQPGVAQRLRDEAHRGAVGGHRQVDRAVRALDRGELLDEHGQMGPHGRLATGEADPAHAVALDEDPREALDLLERHHLRARQPLHPLLGHAVGAAEVAAVGDRDPQVLDHPTEGVDQWRVRHVEILRGGSVGSGVEAGTSGRPRSGHIEGCLAISARNSSLVRNVLSRSISSSRPAAALPS